MKALQTFTPPAGSGCAFVAEVVRGAVVALLVAEAERAGVGHGHGGRAEGRPSRSSHNITPIWQCPETPDSVYPYTQDDQVL